MRRIFVRCLVSLTILGVLCSGRRTECINSGMVDGKMGMIVPSDYGTDVNTTCMVDCYVPARVIMQIRCSESGLWDDNNTCQKGHLFLVQEEYLIAGCAVAGVVLVILTCMSICKRYSRRRGNDVSGGAYDNIDVHYYSTIRNNDQGVSESVDSSRSIPELQDRSAVSVATNDYEEVRSGDVTYVSSEPSNPFKTNYITPY